MTHEELIEKCKLNNYPLFGAIAGDVIGAPYEFSRYKSKEFTLFRSNSNYTDDSLMTLAVANALVNGSGFDSEMLQMGRKYTHPTGGYGFRFKQWLLSSEPQPYNSLGNGSAMRVSACAWAFDDLEKVLSVAQKSAEVTHNHPEGVKGAEATAAAIFLARKSRTKEEIKVYTENQFGYALEYTIDEIRPDYVYNETCPGTVPQAIRAFIDGTDFEDSIRNAVSLGGDSDTLAAITGSIAEAYYGGVPDHIKEYVINLLPDDLLTIIVNFGEKFPIKTN